MSQDELEKRLRNVEIAMAQNTVITKNIDKKIDTIVAFEPRINSLENFRSRTYGYAAGIAGLGTIIIFIIDKFF